MPAALSSASIAWPVSASAAGSASLTAASALRAASISDCAFDSRRCSASSSGHSSSPGREPLEFADLPVQALALAQQLGLACGRVVQGIGRAFPGGMGCAEFGRIEAGKAVEQRAHRGSAGQALPGVLAVDVDQVLGDLAQLRHGGTAAVDPGPALALRVDRAAQQQGAVIVAGIGAEAGFVEPGLQAGRTVEFGADLGPSCALAHHAGIAAAAQRELQRVDQDRLAGAGFAGQGGKPAVELDLEFVDDHEIAQGEAAQHLQLTPEFQCSLRRRVA